MANRALADFPHQLSSSKYGQQFVYRYDIDMSKWFDKRWNLIHCPLIYFFAHSAVSIRALRNGSSIGNFQDSGFSSADRWDGGYMQSAAIERYV